MKQRTRTFAIGLSLAALAAGGTAAWADRHMGGMKGDADGNGVITRAEAQTGAQQKFTMMDVNKDGKLDQADRAARRTAMFDRMDTDKNGQISRAEFDAAHSGPRGHGAMRDGNGPGKGHGMHHGRGERGRGMGGDMMQMADANKDGAISQAEFTTAAMQRFDRTDANKDGQLTKDERQAARRAMWEQMRAASPAPAQAPAPTK